MRGKSAKRSVAKMGRKQWKVKAEMEFEVEAIDGVEAGEAIRDYVTSELVGEETGLGIKMTSMDILEERML